MEKDYYNILSIPRYADRATIRWIANVREAYRVLSVPERRAIYDLFGLIDR